MAAKRRLDLAPEALSVRGLAMPAVLLLVDIARAATLEYISKAPLGHQGQSTYASVILRLPLAQCSLRDVVLGATTFGFVLRPETGGLRDVSGAATLEDRYYYVVGVWMRGN